MLTTKKNLSVRELTKADCEPYALNPVSNKTVEKVGFTFIKQHISAPGSLNFEQLTKLGS